MMRSHDERGFVFRAFANTLTGVGFAIILSVLIALLANTPYPGNLLKSVKRLGVDTSMSIFADLYGTERRTIRPGVKEPRFVFLDIGQEACERYFGPHAPDDPIGTPERCRAGHPAQPEIVYALLGLVLDSSKRAAVVVVDTALIDRSAAPSWPPAGFAPLRTGGLPVVYAVSGRVTDQPRTVWFDTRDDPVAGGLLAQGDAHAALAQTFVEAEDGDEVVRRYAPALIARLVKGDTRVLKATVAMSAAVAAADGNDALTDLAADLDRGGNPGCEVDGGEGDSRRYGFERNLLCLSALTPDADGKSPAHVPELLFTLRSLAYPVSAEPGTSPKAITFSQEDDVENSAYVRIPVNDVERQRNAAASMARFFDGAVVVIGTSAASANDVHATPVGTMAGAEVVLNATRAFLSFPAGEHPSVIEEIGHELFQIGFITPPFLAIWLVVEGLSSLLEGASWMRDKLLRLSIGVVFVAGIFGLFVLLLWWEVDHSVAYAAEGKPPPDILTPIVAVSLEGFAKAARWLLDALHGRVEQGMSKLPWVGDV